MACIYICEERKITKTSYPNLNIISLLLCLYFEMKRLPRLPHLSPLQHLTKVIHLFLLFFFIGHSSPKNGILCIEIFFLIKVSYLLQHAILLCVSKFDVFTQ